MVADSKEVAEMLNDQNCIDQPGLVRGGTTGLETLQGCGGLGG